MHSTYIYLQIYPHIHTHAPKAFAAFCPSAIANVTWNADTAMHITSFKYIYLLFFFFVFLLNLSPFHHFQRIFVACCRRKRVHTRHITQNKWRKSCFTEACVQVNSNLNGSPCFFSAASPPPLGKGKSAISDCCLSLAAFLMACNNSNKSRHACFSSGFLFPCCIHCICAKMYAMKFLKLAIACFFAPVACRK